MEKLGSELSGNYQVKDPFPLTFPCVSSADCILLKSCTSLYQMKMKLEFQEFFSVKCSGEIFPGENTGSQISAGKLFLEKLRVRAPNTMLIKCRNKSLWGCGYGTEIIHNFSIKPHWCPAVFYPSSHVFLGMYPIGLTYPSVCLCPMLCLVGIFFPLFFFLLLQNPDRNIPAFMASGLIWEDWRDNVNTQRSGEQNLTFGLKCNRLRQDHWSNVHTPLSFVLEINIMGRSECLQPIWELRQTGRISSPGWNI